MLTQCEVCHVPTSIVAAIDAGLRRTTFYRLNLHSSVMNHSSIGGGWSFGSSGTAQGGQFVINGTPQTGGHEIDVNPMLPSSMWAARVRPIGVTSPQTHARPVLRVIEGGLSRGYPLHHQLMLPRLLR